MNILSDFYTQEVLSTGHIYSPSGIFKQIDPDNDLSVSIHTLHCDQLFFVTIYIFNKNLLVFNVSTVILCFHIFYKPS